MITQKPTSLQTEPVQRPSVPPVAPRTYPSDSAPRGRRLFPLGRPWIVGIIVVALVAAVWAIARYMNAGASAPHFLTAPAGYKNINSVVLETGTVNPVNEVNVGTQVSGTINSLSVDFNSIVRKGQVLATLDQTSLQATALQAHGTYAAAQSNSAASSSSAMQSGAAIQAAIDSANQTSAMVQSAAANVTKANAQLALSHSMLVRDRSLLAQGFIAQSQVDTQLAADNANASDVRAARAALAAARAQAAASATQIGSATDQHAASLNQVSAAAAQAQAAQGQVLQADYNLQRAVITSPIDGVVVSRNVSIGQTVAASFQTPTLFIIASSLRDMQEDVSVSEADVGQLRTGQGAQISVPAYPNIYFQGTVQQIRINPTTVSNVVTYDAIVGVHDGSSRLKPGMTANVTIAVAARDHVLAIPAAALLFKPASNRAAKASGSSGAPAASVAGAAGSQATVWVLRKGNPASVPIVIGISDGVNYEVRSGGLRPGDQLIIGQLQTQQYSGTNPIAGGPALGR